MSSSRMPTAGRALLAAVLVVPGLASAEEIWVLPSSTDADYEIGSWVVTKHKSTHFSLAIPDDYDSLDGAYLVAIGKDCGPGGTVNLDLEVRLSVSANGQDQAYYTDTALVNVTFTEDEVTEIDISSLLDIAYVPGVDYVGLEVTGANDTFLLGMRTAYTSTDADTDATNELNTSLQLNGTSLELTDAGGTLIADLSSLEESADILAEELRATAAESAIQAALDAHIAADADTDAANELNTGFTLSGNTLTIDDAGGSLAVDLSAFEESADISALATDLATLESELDAHLAADTDTDATNEFNTGASLTGTVLSVTDGGGSVGVDLASLVNDADADPTNELQTIARTGLNVTLSNSGGSFSVADDDNDPGNELQSLSLVGNSLSISGGNSVSLPSGADNLGNHIATTTLQMDGNDLDFIRGDIGQVRSVGRISFDWTAGTYDNSSYHGIESESESGGLADSVRINSYNDVTVTLDSNNNNSTSYFTVQKHSTGNGADAFWVRDDGLVWGRHQNLTSGAVTSYDDDGSRDCPSSRVARGFDADDFGGLVDRIRLNCAYVQ